MSIYYCILCNLSTLFLKKVSHNAIFIYFIATFEIIYLKEEVFLLELFSIRFKEERKNKGLTQEQLAKEFFLNKSSISRYEKGTQMPEMVMLQKFAEYFDVSVDYLLGRTDERNVHKEKSKLDEGIKTIAAHRININEDLPDDAIEKINEYIKMVEMMYKNNNK